MSARDTFLGSGEGKYVMIAGDNTDVADADAEASESTSSLVDAEDDDVEEEDLQDCCRSMDCCRLWCRAVLAVIGVCLMFMREREGGDDDRGSKTASQLEGSSIEEAEEMVVDDDWWRGGAGGTSPEGDVGAGLLERGEERTRRRIRTEGTWEDWMLDIWTDFSFYDKGETQTPNGRVN